MATELVLSEYLAGKLVLAYENSTVRVCTWSLPCVDHIIHFVVEHPFGRRIQSRLQVSNEMQWDHIGRAVLFAADHIFSQEDLS